MAAPDQEGKVGASDIEEACRGLRGGKDHGLRGFSRVANPATDAGRERLHVIIYHSRCPLTVKYEDNSGDKLSAPGHNAVGPPPCCPPRAVRLRPYLAASPAAGNRRAAVTVGRAGRGCNNPKWFP